MLGRSRPGVHGAREPIGIIKGPSGNPTYAGHRFGGPGHRRPTGRTKFRCHPSVTFIGAVFIGSELPLRDGDVSVGKIHRDPEGTPSAPLTQPTMAHPGQGQIRIPYNSITNRPTQTPTFMDFCHFGTLPLSANYRKLAQKERRAGVFPTPSSSSTVSQEFADNCPSL